MSELISVIVPVYNVENYLHECLGSILSQTYQNLDIILVNDGSTDRSGQICDDYAAKDSRIRVIHQENGGLSKARNVGIAAARGAYLTLVDSDDGIHEPFIETLYDQLIAHQADMAISNYYKYDERDGKFYFHNLNQDDLVEVLTPQECLDYQCHVKPYPGFAMVTAWGKLYKKSLFDYISFPVGKLMEDEMTTHKLYLASRRIVFVNQNHYLYRVRSGSITTDPTLFLKRTRHIIQAYEMKLTDLIIAQKKLELMINKFFQKLLSLKRELEEHRLEDSPEYQVVCQRLIFFEKDKFEKY